MLRWMEASTSMDGIINKELSHLNPLQHVSICHEGILCGIFHAKIPLINILISRVFIINLSDFLFDSNNERIVVTPAVACPSLHYILCWNNMRVYK